MATNRGAYDPRQFLHYPDKNPFSDESQQRLEDLVKDFLNTGIAFANGASVHDLAVGEQRKNVELNVQGLNGVAELEEEPSPEAVGYSDDGDDEHEDELFKVDKGKGRDEREGPGLQGLWTRTNNLVSSTSSSKGINADDAISLSSSSDVNDAALEEIEFEEPEDEEGLSEEDSYPQGYLNRGIPEDEHGLYQDEGSESGTELGPINSRGPSSDKDIIYIGDSDEDEPNSHALSDMEANEGFEDDAGLSRRDERDIQLENGSSSELDEMEEQVAHDNVWRPNDEGQDEEGKDGREWQHHSQGKESDEDGGIAPADNDHEEDEKREFTQMREAETNSTARYFFTSAPLVDPWAASGPEALSKLLPLASSELEHPLRSTNEQKHGSLGVEEDRIGERDMAPDTFRPRESDPQDYTATNGSEWPSHLEHDTDPSLSLISTGVDEAGMPLQPASITGPDTLAPVSASGHTTSVQDADPARDDEAKQQLSEKSLHILDEDEARGKLCSLTSTELPYHDGITAPITAPSAEAFNSPQDFTSLFSASSLLSSSIAYPTVSLPPADPGEVLDFYGIVPTMDFSESGMLLPVDVRDAHPFSPAAESSSSRAGVAITEAMHNEEILFDDSTGSSGPPTEPILRDATFSRIPNEIQGHVDGGLMVEVTQADGVGTQDSDSPAATTKSAEVFSEVHQEVQSEIDDEQPVLTALRPAIFDETERGFPSSPSMAKTGSSSPSFECHSVASADLHHDSVMYEESIVIEAHSEGAEEKTAREAEELTGGNPDSTVRLLDYVVDEVTLPEGRDRAASSDSDVHVSEKQTGLHGRPVFSGPVPTISVGSSTPPLSPTATVTNSSSAPDHSVATSDLSTVNQATVSVVTSTSSPPPIHFSHTSPTPAAIRRPQGSRMGIASDEDEDEISLPDPRLPPEPTHLRIPVGVVSRGLADDKEERAESVKVEPPTPHVRSEFGDGSITDVGEVSAGDRVISTLELQVITDDKSRGLETAKQSQEPVRSGRKASTGSPNYMESDDKGSMELEIKRDAENIISELAYPDTDSDHFSGGDAGRGSIPVTGQPYGTSEGGEGSPPPRANHVTDSHRRFSEDNRTEVELRDEQTIIQPSQTPSQNLQPLDGITSLTSKDASSTVLQNVDIDQASVVNGSSKRSSAGQPSDQVNDFGVDTTGRIGASQNVDATKDGQHAPSNGSLDSPEPTHRDVLPVTPTLAGNGSPSKAKHSPRSSTKGKGKSRGKATMSFDSRSDSPPPQSSIRVQGRSSISPRKRSRESDATIAPSKERRLTRSATAKNRSTISTGDITSASAISDDKSDISSIASSSSLVSRILRSTSSKPSSFVTIPSRSPSLVSQSSPTNSMAPPIRPYVPHNHSHHTPVPPIPTGSTRRHTTPLSQRNISASPPPSTPSQSTPAHLTRASCTDHKISIPGPRGLIYFLVPRCSLLDPEVEKDDSIVDCGVATREEVKRAVGDLEAVGLDSDTLGVIRQLAGVQLMREGQVGYLPKPGERIRHHVKQRRLHVPPPSLIQDVAPQVDPSGPSGADSSHIAPLNLESTTSPASSSGSSFSDVSKPEDFGAYSRRRSKTLNGDHGTYEPSPENEEEENGDEGAIVPPAPHSSPQTVRTPKSNRARKRGLRTDDAAYKPENDIVESSSDVELSGTKKKVKATLKRRRSEASTPGENVSGVDVESRRASTKKKRKRRHTALPANHDASRESVSETRRKRAKRKTANSHNGDILNPPA